MKKFLMVVASLLFVGSAFAFPLEWMLVQGDVRERLATTLRAEERLDELNFLESVWEGNAGGAETAARIIIDKTHDPDMTRWLAGYLRRTGRVEEASQIASCQKKLQSLALRTDSPDVTSHRPVVFLHGYNGSADTWSDFVEVFRKVGYGADDILVFDYGEMFDADEDTPIETLATKVVSRVRTWLRERARIPADDASHDAELAAPDWVCHSMGGLVFRVVLKDAPNLVHRCVTLGTPHFGQGIGELSGIAILTGYQTEQMSYGSSFLWNLAADWHYHAHRTDDILFIAGAVTTDKYLSDKKALPQDGLVNTFSATMLTQADGAAFATRTFYVNRIHSTVLDFIYGGKYAGLVSLPGGEDDPVFKLVHGYLNESSYFADGAVPSQEQILEDEGLTPTQMGEIFSRVRKHGALFVQVMEPVTNTALRVQQPIEYDPGYWWDPTPDSIVKEFVWQDQKWTGDDDGLICANGSGDEGCENGLVLLYGNIPTGTIDVVIEKPSKYAGPLKFPYSEQAVIYGGGTTLWRTRPGAVKPMSAVSVADDSGQVRTLIVSNAWLAATGLVTSAEDLLGCVMAASASGENGYSVALSALLGLDPCDPASNVHFSGIDINDDMVKLSLLVGERPLLSDAPFALQGKPLFTDTWNDLSVATRTSGLWSLPVSSNHFFRAVFRW